MSERNPGGRVAEAGKREDNGPVMSDCNTRIIAPSLLAADWSKVGEEVRRAEQAGADWLHLDVMDGHFVENVSFGLFIVETVRKLTRLPVDSHLMIENPERYIQDFIQAGSDWVSVHIEGNSNIHRTLQSIRAQGAKAGIVLNPGTPVIAIEAVAPIVDYILLMSVNPGFSGQKFIPETVKRIREVCKLAKSAGVNPIIQVDGGISAETLPACAAAGANCFVAATSVFKHPQGIAAGVRALRGAG